MEAAFVGHAHAKAALDIACWDIFGKSVGLPVCDLLGGKTDVGLPKISSIPVDDPDKMYRNVAEHRARGYIGHSIKVNGDLVTDALRIAACLSGKSPEKFFLVDANCGLTVETALRMLRLLPSGLDFVFESPCATWWEHVSLRRRTKVTLIFDELATDPASVLQLIADDAAEGIGLKITKAGGLTKSRRIRDICIAAGYTLSVQDTFGSDISFAAIVHLAQTIPDKFLRCILHTPEMVTLKAAEFANTTQDGRITASDAPRLGISPDLKVLGQPVATYR